MLTLVGKLPCCYSLGVRVIVPILNPETLSFNAGSLFEGLVIFFGFQLALLMVTVVGFTFHLASGELLNL